LNLNRTRPLSDLLRGGRKCLTSFLGRRSIHPWGGPPLAATNLFRYWTPGDFNREAAEFCALAQDSYGLDLDYSPDTLRQLDNIINDHFAPGSADDHPALIVSMGCYVGEVIIRSHGGRWQADEEIFHSPAVIIEGRLQARTFPLSRVWRRFEYGENESLVAYYGEVSRTLSHI